MTVDQIAMVAAKMATLPRGKPNPTNPSNEGISAAQAAKAAGVPKTAIDSAKVVLQHGTPDEREAVESGEAPARKTADRIRARRRNSAPVAPRGKKMPFHSRDPIDDVTRKLITTCAGPMAKWRSLDKMSWIIDAAKSTIEKALERLGEAVKTRASDRDDEYLIEGDREELLVRAGLMMAHQSAASDELANLRAENADSSAVIASLRAQLADANAKIERLENALHKDVVETIAAKLVANGKTNPTVDDVVVAALRLSAEDRQGQAPVFGEKEIA
jgi:hypothetical protein